MESTLVYPCWKPAFFITKMDYRSNSETFTGLGSWFKLWSKASTPGLPYHIAICVLSRTLSERGDMAANVEMIQFNVSLASYGKHVRKQHKGLTLVQLTWTSKIQHCSTYKTNQQPALGNWSLGCSYHLLRLDCWWWFAFQGVSNESIWGEIFPKMRWKQKTSWS